MWVPIDGRIITVSQLKPIIQAMQFPGNGAMGFRPSGGTLHNTAVPDMGRARQFSHEHWRDGWLNYYKNERRWPSGPHAFVFEDGKILLFTPFNQKGTHSPSWNGTKFGVEMVADFAKDDDDAGPGKIVKLTAAAVFAILYERLGLDPAGIVLHKEDRRTDHDCPGRDINKAEFIELVEEYMGHAGDHPNVPDPTNPPTPPAPRAAFVNTPDLNLRAGSSASARILAKLPKGERIEILDSAMNGKTKWLQVKVPRLKSAGWVSAQYVDL